MTSTSPRPAATPAAGLSPALTGLIATACGVCVANIYYAQPLLDPIAGALAVPASLAGLLLTLTQLGYGAGLLLLVPLTDVVENRRLVLGAMGGAVLGLVGAACATGAAMFLAASFVVGVCVVAAQVLVPFASHLTPEASRGRVVGNVMAGLLAGIMLARPFASIVAAGFGWRAVFGVSALVMVVLMAVIARALPERRPHGSIGYARTLASLPSIVATTPLLRRRAYYQGLMFASFQVFWTGVPLALAHTFGFGQESIAAFALAGAAGALVAPLAGRAADRGWTRPVTGGALVAALVAAPIAAFGVARHSLVALVVAALLLDAAVQLCQVLNLRSLYMLAPELRGRLNALYMTWIFICAAAASGTAAAVYAFHGWAAICWLWAALVAAALAGYATEFTRRRV